MKGTVGITNTVYIAGLYEYSGGANTRYYTGPGGVVAMRRTGYASGNGVFCLLTDQLNSTARMVNSAGAIQETNYFFPFGGNRGGATTLTTKRFTGQYHESSLPGGEGLYYYNARWYDAKLGRFVSADSIVPDAGNPQSFNRYSYVYNNPLRFIDPSGHVGIGITGNCMCGGARYEGSDGFYVGPSASNKREAYRAFEVLPYADTPNDFLVVTTGCGYACRAGYEDEVGWGWRLLAGAGLLLPIGYRSAKTGLAGLEGVQDAIAAATVRGHKTYWGRQWVTWSRMGETKAGGILWGADEAVADKHAYMLVNRLQKTGSSHITILSGTHGEWDGATGVETPSLKDLNLYFEDVIYYEDVANVTVLDVTTMSTAQLQALTGQIVCAWCFSERSTLIQGLTRR